MCKVCSVAYGGIAMGLAAASSGAVPVSEQLSPKSQYTEALVRLQLSAAAVEGIAVPGLKDPQWLVQQKAAAQQAAATRAVQAPANSKRVVTYDVMTRGAITANVEEFKAQALATLNDTRGWARLGVAFRQVSSGGQFTLVLSEASQVPSFSPGGCGVEYSCRVGRYVIINQDRWLYATPSWNNAGGNLRDYRHMVVNHETGHWLGHGHSACGGVGQAAPVMQQQSMDLQGCRFNPWPLAGELHSTQLGVG